MRFIVMHKVDARMEAGAPPDQQIVSGMGALVQESLKSGVFTNGAGLHPSRQRVRLERAHGQWSETRGPYQGHNELVASLAMVRAGSMTEAVQAARAFAEISGDSEVEIGPVVEPWDLGLIPKPSHAPQRFLYLFKANAEFERGALAADARDRALAELRRTLEPDGAVLAAEVLAPSSRGARLASSKDAKRTWVDGPFAESKELIAGFSILELPTFEQAKAWADRYAAILGENEVDIRELA
jgi:hypothetical protein